MWGKLWFSMTPLVFHLQKAKQYINGLRKTKSQKKTHNKYLHYILQVWHFSFHFVRDIRVINKEIAVHQGGCDIFQDTRMNRHTEERLPKSKHNTNSLIRKSREKPLCHVLFWYYIASLSGNHQYGKLSFLFSGKAGAEWTIQYPLSSLKAILPCDKTYIHITTI